MYNMCLKKIELKTIIVSAENKRRFIEVLLLISSILAALKQIKFTFLFFMLFLIMSVMYYATLFVKPKNKKRFWLVPFLISLFFSAFTSLYLIESLGLEAARSISAIIILYYLALIFVISRILMAKEP